MTLNTTRVLVTGGAGAIGSHVVRTLVRRGAYVSVVDNLDSGRAEHVPPGVTLHVMSILDPRVAHLVRDAEVVVHLAAKFANQNSVDHPLEDAMVNAVGTLQLLEWARGRVRRFVYASTSCVGAVRTPYAISKKAGEDYVRTYAAVHGLSCAVVRYFNVYGPYDYPGPYRSVIPNMLATALRGEPVTIYGTGEETRDFTFAADAAEATVRAAEVEAHDAVIEVGTGRETTIRALAELVNAVTGNGAGIGWQPRRSWDTVRTRRANVEAARAILGYVPETTLEEGLTATCAWLRGRLCSEEMRFGSTSSA